MTIFHVIKYAGRFRQDGGSAQPYYPLWVVNKYIHGDPQREFEAPMEEEAQFTRLLLQYDENLHGDEVWIPANAK